MEAFENVLYSYIISIIENEFFGNGFFVEKALRCTALALLPLSILMLSQTLTKLIHQSISSLFQSGQTSALASLSIRCNFHLFPDLSSWNQPLSRGQTKLSFSREQVCPSEKIFHLSISPKIVIISIQILTKVPKILRIFGTILQNHKKGKSNLYGCSTRLDFGEEIESLVEIAAVFSNSDNLIGFADMLGHNFYECIALTVGERQHLCRVIPASDNLSFGATFGKVFVTFGSTDEARDGDGVSVPSGEDVNPLTALTVNHAFRRLVSDTCDSDFITDFHTFNVEGTVVTLFTHNECSNLFRDTSCNNIIFFHFLLF